MPTVNTPTVTTNSFSVSVGGMSKNEIYRFFLYYDNSPKDPTQIGSTDEYKATKDGEVHTFSKTGLKPDRALFYTIIYLPAGKTDWTVEADIKYAAKKRTARTLPEKVWPGDWTKWANLKAGDPITTVKATDWNDFLDHINKVIDYKGGAKFNFTNYKKVKGDEMNAKDFNDGAAAAMQSIGLNPPMATAGGTVTAQFFKNYEDQLNRAE